MQFLASEVIYLLFETAHGFLYLVLLRALLSSFFLSRKRYFCDPRNTTPSFYERLMCPERNAFLHAKAVFSFFDCVPTSLVGNKILMYILLVCF